jgi:hypothetical protein
MLLRTLAHAPTPGGAQAEADKAKRALDEFQALRDNAIQAHSGTEGSLESLWRYFGQLEHAKDKFLVSETAVSVCCANRGGGGGSNARTRSITAPLRPPIVAAHATRPWPPSAAVQVKINFVWHDAFRPALRVGEHTAYCVSSQPLAVFERRFLYRMHHRPLSRFIHIITSPSPARAPVLFALVPQLQASTAGCSSAPLCYTTLLPQRAWPA